MFKQEQYDKIAGVLRKLYADKWSHAKGTEMGLVYEVARGLGKMFGQDSDKFDMGKWLQSIFGKHMGTVLLQGGEFTIDDMPGGANWEK